MAKTLFQLIWFAVYIVVGVQSYQRNGTEFLADGITPLLKLVATVDGKSFFQDFQDGTAKRTWSDARNHCWSLAMKLASITTKAQLDALNGAYSGEFAHDFWTAGRDSHELTQFVWDGSGTPVSQVALPAKNYLTYYHSCVANNSNPSSQSHLIFQTCNHNYGVLCQT